MGKLHPAMQAIIDAVKENEKVSSRDVAARLNIEKRRASDGMAKLTKRGYFTPIGIKQYRKYIRTSKQPDDRHILGLDSIEFEWHKDPSSFQMRVGR